MRAPLESTLVASIASVACSLEEAALPATRGEVRPLPTPGGHAMAAMPCSMCGKQYRRAAVHIYPAMGTELTTVREHLRICPDCAAGYELMLSSRFDDWDEPQKDEVVWLCFICQSAFEPQERIRYSWVTSYFKKDERKNWTGVFHAPCSGGARARLGLPAE